MAEKNMSLPALAPGSTALRVEQIRRCRDMAQLRSLPLIEVRPARPPKKEDVLLAKPPDPLTGLRRVLATAPADAVRSRAAAWAKQHRDWLKPNAAIVAETLLNHAVACTTAAAAAHCSATCDAIEATYPALANELVPAAGGIQPGALVIRRRAAVRRWVATHSVDELLRLAPYTASWQLGVGPCPYTAALRRGGMNREKRLRLEVLRDKYGALDQSAA